MPVFLTALHAWPADEFGAALKGELERLPGGSLPLHLATTQGGQVDDADISVTVLGSDDAGDHIVARVGVFFTEVVGGCNCHDDPVRANAYCTLAVRIDKAGAGVSFELLPD